MKILVFGLGYVGVSLSVMLSKKHNVIAVDIDKSKVNRINNRSSPIEDDLISEWLSTNLNLTAQTLIPDDVCDFDFCFIALPTNFDQSKKYLDTSMLRMLLS